jgi:hypothetical protein
VEGEIKSARLEAHLAACLRCQAEASRHRRITRELAELGSSGESAPPFLAPAVANRVAEMAPAKEGAPAEGVADDSESPGSQGAAKVAVAGALAAAAGTAVAVRLVRSRPVA